MSEISKQTRLSQEEISRYSRHLILPEVGLQGQLKLKNSKVLGGNVKWCNACNCIIKHKTRLLKEKCKKGHW